MFSDTLEAAPPSRLTLFLCVAIAISYCLRLILCPVSVSTHHMRLKLACPTSGRVWLRKSFAETWTAARRVGGLRVYAWA